ncbi:hypothetical protein QJS04_geneDACA018486 [Acorus gramineus]|uniref:Uncharacterized protein n=1 Tax=Acorus gramineus TaxID=55184 RepID=A0AAV9AXN9_ACOGR|nr:hypothetical protein QJS04_geneDACA018486 [Acorus gramineus]
MARTMRAGDSLKDPPSNPSRVPSLLRVGVAWMVRAGDSVDGLTQQSRSSLPPLKDACDTDGASKGRTDGPTQQFGSSDPGE